MELNTIPPEDHTSQLVILLRDSTSFPERNQQGEQLGKRQERGKRVEERSILPSLCLVKEWLVKAFVLLLSPPLCYDLDSTDLIQS
jgi:hypothetical protein